MGQPDSSLRMRSGRRNRHDPCAELLPKMRLSHKTILFVLILVTRVVFGGEPAAPSSVREAPTGTEPAQDTVARAALVDLLARAEALSRSGKPAEAYALLLSAEDTYIGTIDFDYALGRAALDAGRPDKATLALNRVLALDPVHAGASIDVGRAYLALGDFARARRAFQNLLSLDPPPQVRSQLQAFLDLTEASAAESAAVAPGALSHQGYLAALIGRSSNVNQAPSQSVIFVPGMGSNFELPGQNVQMADGFAGIGGGVDFSKNLGGTYATIFGGEFLGRRNFHEFDFDVGGYSLYLGLTAVNGPHAAKIQGFFGRNYLGGSANRDLDGVTANYVGALDADTQFLATAQVGQQRYVPEDLRIYDADFSVLGAGAARKLGERSTVFAMFSTGYQKDTGGSPDGNKELVGFQAGGEMLIGTRTKATAAAVGERSRYDKFNTGFQTERHDIRRAFDLGAQYFLDRNLSLRFNVSYAYTRSNIPIYEYTRAEWTAMLRRDFR